MASEKQAEKGKNPQAIKKNHSKPDYYDDPNLHRVLEAKPTAKGPCVGCYNPKHGFK